MSTSKVPIQHRLNSCTMKELTAGMLRMTDPVILDIMIREYNRRISLEPGRMQSGHPATETLPTGNMLCSYPIKGSRPAARRLTWLNGEIDEVPIERKARLGQFFKFPRPAERFGYNQISVETAGHEKVWLTNVAYNTENFMLGFYDGMPRVVFCTEGRTP